MALNKYNTTSDAIANLYRASLYLARHSKGVGIGFLLKAKDELGNRISLDVDEIAKGNVFKKPYDYYYWAEKVLDEYKRLKMGLSSN